MTAKFGSFFEHAEMGEKRQIVISFSAQIWFLLFLLSIFLLSYILMRFVWRSLAVGMGGWGWVCVWGFGWMGEWVLQLDKWQSLYANTHYKHENSVLKGVLHPNLKLACFVCNLKIINTLLKIGLMHVTHPKANCQRNSKMAFKF